MAVYDSDYDSDSERPSHWTPRRSRRPALPAPQLPTALVLVGLLCVGAVFVNSAAAVAVPQSRMTSRRSEGTVRVHRRSICRMRSSRPQDRRRWRRTGVLGVLSVLLCSGTVVLQRALPGGHAVPGPAAGRGRRAAPARRRLPHAQPLARLHPLLLRAPSLSLHTRTHPALFQYTCSY